MLDAIQTAAADQVEKLVGRFAALQRLANLMHLAGLQVPIPDLSAMLPAGVVDIDKYNQLAALCPGLLPPSTAGNVDDLQGAMSNAYQCLAQRLNSHPFVMMATLQSQVDQLVNEVGESFQRRIGPGIQGIACAQAICGTVSQLGVYSPASSQALVSQYKDGVGQRSTVLTPAQQADVTRALTAKTNLTYLIGPGSGPG